VTPTRLPESRARRPRVRCHVPVARRAFTSRTTKSRIAQHEY
jgi:hypothetical protein